MKNKTDTFIDWSNVLDINWDNVLETTKGDEFLSTAEICKKMGYGEQICVDSEYRDIYALLVIMEKYGYVKRIKAPGRIGYLYNKRMF